MFLVALKYFGIFGQAFSVTLKKNLSNIMFFISYIIVCLLNICNDRQHFTFLIFLYYFGDSFWGLDLAV